MSGPRVIVVAGPAGSGKTTVGSALAAALGARFVDADDLHAPASKERMARGIGLTDAERAPWLAALRAEIAAALASAGRMVLACSGLRRAHRDALVPTGAPAGAARIVYLRAEPGLLARRLEARAGHFAGAALLPSQLATQEEPRPGEGVLVLDAAATPEALVAEIRARLGL